MARPLEKFTAREAEKVGRAKTGKVPGPWRARFFAHEEPTGFLLAKPFVLDGVGRLLDFGAKIDVYPQQSLPPAVADWLALYSDWKVVGQDLRNAFLAAIAEFLRDKEKIPAIEELLKKELVEIELADAPSPATR